MFIFSDVRLLSMQKEIREIYQIYFQLLCFPLLVSIHEKISGNKRQYVPETIKDNSNRLVELYVDVNLHHEKFCIMSKTAVYLQTSHRKT